MTFRRTWTISRRRRERPPDFKALAEEEGVYSRHEGGAAVVWLKTVRPRARTRDGDLCSGQGLGRPGHGWEAPDGDLGRDPARRNAATGRPIAGTSTDPRGGMAHAVLRNGQL